MQQLCQLARRAKRLLLLAALSLAALAALPAHAAPPSPLAGGGVVSVPAASGVFLQLNNPVGITTDQSGLVYIVAQTNSGFSTIGQFAPDGSFLQQMGDSVVFLNYIASDSATGLLWSLVGDGRIFAVNPQTKQTGLIVNLGLLDIDVTRVYNVQARAFQSFAGVITRNNTVYRGLAIWRSGSRLEIYATAVAGQTTAFVVRVSVINTAIQSARAIVASDATAFITTGNLDARGVAASPQGIVLTTLPIAINNQNTLAAYDSAFVFPVDFPDADMPPRPLFTNIPGVTSPAQISSSAIASDANGNFLIATGNGDAPLCALLGQAAANSSPLVLITWDLAHLSCAPSIGISRGVAVSPNGRTAYLTTSSNYVLEFGVTTPPPPKKRFLPLIKR